MSALEPITATATPSSTSGGERAGKGKQPKQPKEQKVQKESSSTNTLTEKQKEKAALAKAKKKKKEKAKKKAKRAKKNTLKTKIVVRRLPPNLPEEAFMNACKRWIGDDVVDYKFYVPGKLSQSKGKENVFSRAYFHMKTMDAVVAFHQGFDGHIFLDNKGTESRAVVEFAPFQKLPKEHKNPDARQGTIDEDPEYLKFLESLEADKNKATESKESGADVGGTQLERLENRLALVTAQTLAAEQANKPKTTPLLDHLRAQKAAQAAAKAKAQAAKAAKKKAAKEKAKKAKEKAAAASSSSTASTTPNNANVTTAEGGEAGTTTTKKPPRRNKKKKDQDKKEKETNNNDNNNNTKGSNKESNNKQKPKSDKTKKPKPNKKDGNKESKNKQRNEQSKQQPVVQILGRSNKDENKTKVSSSSASSPASNNQQRAG